MKPPIFLAVFVCLAACSAPQGKKLGALPPNSKVATVTPAAPGLAPVATGPGGESSPATLTMPTTTAAVLTYQDIRPLQGGHEEIVGLHPGKTVTVKLPALQRKGCEWRLSEIPDPSVLKLVSKEYTPGPHPAKPGEQTIVFEGVGPGDVNVKMWYGTTWMSPMETPVVEFIASVTPEPAKEAKKSKKGKKP